MSADKEALKPVCKHGSSCYRKNPRHLKTYSHPCETQDSPANEANDKDQDSTSPHPPPSKRPRKSEDSSESDKENDTVTSCCKKSKDDSIHTNTKEDDSICCTSDTNESNKGCESATGTDLALKDDVRTKISELFLVLNMPEDFYQLWDFCIEQNPKHPYKTLEPLQLYMTGPYDVLLDKIPDKSSWEQCVLHGRHYYDPPEFVTVLMDNNEDKGYHIGYFRDDPESSSCLVVCNTVSDGCTIKILGNNIFTALLSVCQSMIKMSSKDNQRLLQTLHDKLTQTSHSLGIDTKPFKNSERKPVSKCFNQIGISVPVDTVNDVGYRSLTMTNKQLKNVLNDISLHSSQTAKDRLRELVTYIQFANDECDYGMGLELGIDLFCYGDEVFHDRILHLLSLAYDLLDRQQYGKIIEQHLKNRTKPKFVLH